MKQLIVSILLGSAALPVAAQQPACQTVRTGIFQLTSPTGVKTRIIRTANRQTELMSNSTQPTDYTVEWLDDCTYVLIPRASVFDKYPLMPRDARLTVRIVGTSKQGYSLEATSNFSSAIMRSEVARLK